MSQSGAGIAEECILKFNELKLNKKWKYVIYKLSDDNKQFVVEDAGEASGGDPEANWEILKEKLLAAKSKSKTGQVGDGPRYAIYDFDYQLAPGEGSRSKVVFISWVPDSAGVMSKMVYASSKQALLRSFNGIAADIKAADSEELEYQVVLKQVDKNAI